MVHGGECDQLRASLIVQARAGWFFRRVLKPPRRLFIMNREMRGLWSGIYALFGTVESLAVSLNWTWSWDKHRKLTDRWIEKKLAKLVARITTQIVTLMHSAFLFTHYQLKVSRGADNFRIRSDPNFVDIEKSFFYIQTDMNWSGSDRMRIRFRIWY